MHGGCERRAFLKMWPSVSSDAVANGGSRDPSSGSLCRIIESFHGEVSEPVCGSIGIFGTVR